MPLVKDSKGRQVVPIVIYDEPLPISDPEKVFPVINSKTGETVHYYASTDIVTCDAACEAAYTAFQKRDGGWKRATHSTRRDLLLKVADLFAERQDELVETQMAETACERMWAVNNVMTTVNYIKEIAANVSTASRGMFPFLHYFCCDFQYGKSGRDGGPWERRDREREWFMLIWLKKV